MTYSSGVHFARRTPFQTFVLLPLRVLACELWGYAQYRLYRLQLGGGGPGNEGSPGDSASPTLPTRSA